MSNSYDWISASSRFTHGLDGPREEPKIDEEVSHIVHKKVFATDKRLIDLVVKFKRQSDPESLEPLNLMKNPHFIAELKEVFK